jgi:acyl-coenzyme A thioesterase PaaI-like protein
VTITPEQATAFVHQTVPAIGRLGVVVEAIGPDAVELRVPIEGNGNHFGTMYAGALFGLCELPGGLIPLGVLDPTKYTPIVTRVDIRFLAAARSDVTLVASIDAAQMRALGAQVDDEGRAEFTLELHGEDADGRTVVSSTAYYQLRPNRG